MLWGVDDHALYQEISVCNPPFKATTIKPKLTYVVTIYCYPIPIFMKNVHYMIACADGISSTIKSSKLLQLANEGIGSVYVEGKSVNCGNFSPGSLQDLIDYA
jgi:hypothetical protein